MSLLLPVGESYQDYLRWSAPPVGGVLDRRVQRYRWAKARSLQMLEYLQGRLQQTPRLYPEYPVLLRQIGRLRACGTWLKFHYYEEPDQYRLVNALFCKQHLLCNFCAIRRAAVKLRAYLDRFVYLLQQRPCLVPHLITFTVKNGPDLLERFKHLRACFKRLQKHRRDFLKCNRGYTEFSKVTGGVGHYEITYNTETGEFHPHLHLVGLVNGYLHQLRMVDEWQAIAKDSFILDVRPFYDYGPGFSDEQNHKSAMNAFREVFKYTLKFSELPVSLNYEIAMQLKGVRLLVSFGDFWGVKVPSELTDDPLTDSYVRYLYEWITDQYLLQEVAPVGVE